MIKDKFFEIIKNEGIKQNINTFIVGGVVRDLVLKKDIKDYDFVIEGSAIEFAKNANFSIKSIHEPFNTVKVNIDETEIDIASTRCEKYPKNGCLPVVDKIGVNIEEDLKRRDFTINSIALNLKTNEYIDPYSGLSDIKNKVLKILHDNSFKDDPTRILRGLDFKYRFNFDFDEKTKALALDTAKNYDREGLSIDRVYLTLNKIFKTSYSDKILKEILENNYYKIWTNRSSINLDEVGFLEETIKKFDVKEKNKFYIAALEAIPYVKPKFKDDFEILNFFKSFNEIQLALYYFKTKDISAYKYLSLKEIKPLINGKALLEKGFKEGKTIGDILNTVKKEKILNKENFKTKEDELNFVMKNFKVNS